jgi:hypothetical protein
MLFFLTYYLWIAPHILLGICLWMFLRRGLSKQFPFFAVYMLSESAYFLASFVAAMMAIRSLSHSLHTYRLILDWGLGIISGMSFGVIYELMNQLILSRSIRADTLQPVMRWAAAALLLMAVVVSVHLGPTIEHLMDVFEVLDLSTNVIQVGLLLVLLLFSRALQVSWRSLPVGIALGLGILGCVELATAPLFSVFSQHRYSVIDDVRMAGFHVCVLVWLGYLVFPEPQAMFVGESPQTSDLESWEQEMQRMARSIQPEE